MKENRRCGCRTKERPISSGFSVRIRMTRTVTPIHFCTMFLLSRLRVGGVEGGRKCLERSLSLIRSIPEDQVVGSYKEVHNTVDYVQYMVANLKFKCLKSDRPLVTK